MYKLAEKIFFIYFHYKSMVDNDMTREWPVWTPGAPLAAFIKDSMVGRFYSRIYKENHYTLLHTKYESFGPCGFREEDFFPMTPPGRGPYGPQGHGWQDL